MSHRAMSLLRNLPPHTPWPLGRARLTAWAPEVGEEVPSASGGQVGPEASPHSVGGGEGWQVTELCLPGRVVALGDAPPGLPPPPARDI